MPAAPGPAPPPLAPLGPLGAASHRARAAGAGYGPPHAGVLGSVAGVRVAEEPPGFRDFVAARWQPLLRTAWSLTGDWALAEDLVQTALAKTWPRWTSIRRSDDPDVYVRRVLVTTYATWWRRKWRGELPTEQLPEPGSELPRADSAEETVLRHTLQQALATLPRRQRAVVVLRYVEDFSEADTAALLGVTVGTVKSQAAKALTKLRGSELLAGVRGEEVTP